MLEIKSLYRHQQMNSETCIGHGLGAITSDDRAHLVFSNQGVKINKEVYVESILENVLKP